MDSQASSLAISTDAKGAADNVCLLTADGVLDSSTYLQLRDAIVKAALDQPHAVLVDVNRLGVPASSAWAVFTSAQWLVDTWPAVPIHLVCGHYHRRHVIALNGVTRYVPVHATVEAALAALTNTERVRWRAKTELPAAVASLGVSHAFVAQRLAEWSLDPLILVTTVVANIFVENVLQHTAGGAVLRLETDGTTITVSAQDDSSALAVRHEDSRVSGERVSGLAIIAAVSRAWGCSPTPHGKTVWAVIGPENQL
jgi:hypothetical protein